LCRPRHSVGESASSLGHRPIFVPLQLKIYTPHSESLQSLIDGLCGKYHDPDELYVAINVNKPGVINFDSIKVPDALRSEMLALWVFGRLADDRTRWSFYGNLLNEPRSFSTTFRISSRSARSALYPSPKGNLQLDRQHARLVI